MVAMFIIMMYLSLEFKKLVSRDETIFMTSAKYYNTDNVNDRNLTYFEDYKIGSNSSDDHISTYSMGEFEDSFNVFFGTANESIDLLDNPYV